MGIGVRRGRGQSKKVKLQTRAITEVMYAAYSFVTTKGSLVIFFWQNTCKLGKKYREIKHFSSCICCKYRQPLPQNYYSAFVVL